MYFHQWGNIRESQDLNYRHLYVSLIHFHVSLMPIDDHVVRAQRVTSMVVLVQLACCLRRCWVAQPPGSGEERNWSRARNGLLEAISHKAREELLCHPRPQIGALPLPALTVWMQIMPVYIYFTPHVCWQLEFFIPMDISANDYHICTCCSPCLTFTGHKRIVVIYGLSNNTKVFLLCLRKKREALSCTVGI